jgi:hypothetical protein
VQSTHHRLSKSDYMAGLQCPKQLWWRVHEPKAEELVPDPALQATFDRGNEVGAVARGYVPGGVLIETDSLDERLRATREAISRGSQVIYEGAIEHNGAVFIADILEREGGAWNLIEVKSSTKVKPAHRPDLALQLYVARSAGLDVRRAELMHLNRKCRYPDLSNLFVRKDLTRKAEKLQAEVRGHLVSFHEVLRGPLPEIEPGEQCSTPYACPFVERCVEAPPVETKTAPTASDGLAQELENLKYPIAYLDFETVAPAIPVWDGCRPYDQIPVQISVHVEYLDGRLQHHEWLAEGSGDPREEMATRILRYTHGTGTILAYYSPFEERAIRALQEAVPHAAPQLDDVLDRMVDLLPFVRDHVEHPAFIAGHGLKIVLPILVPALGYDDLEIADGLTASVTLERMLLGDDMTQEERTAARNHLREYCEVDTLAMVHSLQRLRELAR